MISWGVPVTCLSWTFPDMMWSCNIISSIRLRVLACSPRWSFLYELRPLAGGVSPPEFYKIMWMLQWRHWPHWTPTPPSWCPPRQGCRRRTPARRRCSPWSTWEKYQIEMDHVKISCDHHSSKTLSISFIVLSEMFLFPSNSKDLSLVLPPLFFWCWSR